VFEQVTDRWHTGFVDLSGDQGLVGQVEGRSSGDAGSWLAARTQQWRDGVAAVAIDMCSAYRAAVREHLSHATLVVDHFHVVQLANQVLSSVRRRVTAKVRGRRVRKDDPEYGLRRRLMRNREDLTGEKFTDMWNRLIDLGQAGDEILAAWIAKEELRTLLSLARTGASRHQISHRLWTFYQWCADTNTPELHRLARTIQAWWPQIEAFIHTGITNAASEAINRLIKLEARNAFGFRNATNQRLRSRCASIRASWRRTKPGQLRRHAYSPLSRRMMKSRRSSILSYRLIRSCRVITNGEVELLWPNTPTGIPESTMGTLAERAGTGDEERR
jgi:transposase